MIAYRKATTDDIDALLKLRIDFLRDAKNIQNEGEEAILIQANKNFLSQSLADGSFIQWLAMDGAEIVGSSSVSLYVLPPNAMRLSGKVAYIGNMFTYPAHRKQGIATKLFALAVDSAKAAGCGEVCLDATEMGRPIYEKYGFQKSEDAMHYCI